MTIRKLKAFTLVELLIAMALATAVMAGMLRMFNQAQGSSNSQAQMSILLHRANHITQVLDRVVPNAGNIISWQGAYNDLSTIESVLGVAPVQDTGVDANKNDTWKIILQGNGKLIDCSGQIIPLNKVMEHSFQIEHNTLTCTCTNITDHTPSTTVELAKNVEHMQVLYGIQNQQSHDQMQGLAYAANNVEINGQIGNPLKNVAVNNITVSLLLKSDNPVDVNMPNPTIALLYDPGRRNAPYLQHYPAIAGYAIDQNYAYYKLTLGFYLPNIMHKVYST